MSDQPDDAALTLEFDALTHRAGLTIPQDRRDMVFAGFKDMRRSTALLRQPRTAANEPAGIFDIRTVTRAL